jgi:hypothetical protein
MNIAVWYKPEGVLDSVIYDYAQSRKLELSSKETLSTTEQSELTWLQEDRDVAAVNITIEIKDERLLRTWASFSR